MQRNQGWDFQWSSDTIQSFSPTWTCCETMTVVTASDWYIDIHLCLSVPLPACGSSGSSSAPSPAACMFGLHSMTVWTGASWSSMVWNCWIDEGSLGWRRSEVASLMTCGRKFGYVITPPQNSAALAMALRLTSKGRQLTNPRGYTLDWVSALLVVSRVGPGCLAETRNEIGRLLLGLPLGTVTGLALDLSGSSNPLRASAAATRDLLGVFLIAWWWVTFTTCR